MTSVFLGGSRQLSRLNKSVTDRVDAVIEKGFSVYIGDANGGDRAFQEYLHGRGYKDVTVYCTEGSPRNNLGSWEVRSVPFSGRGRKRFEYYAAKDDAMVRDADHGLFLWDGKSKGTLRNILNMARLGKSSVVYASPKREFHTVRDPISAGKLADSATSDARANLDEALSGLDGMADLLPART